MTDKYQIQPKSHHKQIPEETRKKIQYLQQKLNIWSYLKWQLGAVIAGCFVGSYINLTKNYRQQIKKKPASGYFPQLRYTFNNIYFLQTSITFTSKLLIDLIFPPNSNTHFQYLKGFLVGAITFAINTPLTHINQTQSKIKNPNHNKITKMQAFNFMRKQYGNRSFYAKSSLSRFINVLLFYTLYFGVNDHLTSISGEIPYRYLCNPFLASMAAGIPTFIISRFCMTYTSIENTRMAIAIGSGKKIIQRSRMSILLQTVKKAGGLLKIPIQDKKFQFYTFMTNWLMLSLFTLLQNQTNPNATTSLPIFLSKLFQIYKQDQRVKFQNQKGVILE